MRADARREPTRHPAAGSAQGFNVITPIKCGVISLNPVAYRKCPNLSPLLQVPDIANSHHLDGIGYIEHPASGGFAWPRGHERGGGGGLVVDWVRSSSGGVFV